MGQMPMVAGEPWAALRGLADTYNQANAQNSARLETVREARADNLGFAKDILTSNAALGAFGGGQIGSLATAQGNLPEGMLSGAYTGNMDQLRLAGAVPGAGRGGGGGGGSDGPTGPKDDQMYVEVGGVPMWLDSAAFVRMKEAQTLYGGPEVNMVTPPTTTIGGPGVTVPVPQDSPTDNGDGTTTVNGITYNNETGEPLG